MKVVFSRNRPFDSTRISVDVPERVLASKIVFWQAQNNSKKIWHASDIETIDGLFLYRYRIYTCADIVVKERNAFGTIWIDAFTFSNRLFVL
jgi:hypothetical protein